MLMLLLYRIVKRKTLVLDLDETLIHSHHNGNTMRKTEPPTKLSGKKTEPLWKEKTQLTGGN